jgi:hypothetical protein
VAPPGAALTAQCDALCRSVRDQSSASSAKTVRAILSGVCGLAVRYGALTTNPVREVAQLESRKAKNKPQRARALTGEELLDLLAKPDTDERAILDDLPDLVGSSWPPVNAPARRSTPDGRTSTSARW